MMQRHGLDVLEVGGQCVQRTGVGVRVYLAADRIIWYINCVATYRSICLPVSECWVGGAEKYG